MKSVKRIFGKHLAALTAGIILLFVALACDTKSDADWKNELHGKKLTMASTSGSFSDRIDIWFCGSGEYALRSESTGMSGGGGGTLSMASEDFEQGKWSVESSTLILQSQDGQTGEYSISPGTEQDVIYLNGNAYLVTEHGECR
jgi:hypothetical protein